VFLLPEETPQKAFLQFLALVVVVGTLVRGLALPRIVRWLRLSPPNGAKERMEAQMLMAEVRSAGISRLETAATETDNDAVIERLRADAALSARAEGRYQETAIRAVLAAIDAEEIALRVIGRRIDSEQ
jgi:NhaP-type Na+/H+ or K+/H+ antiporter